MELSDKEKNFELSALVLVLEDSGSPTTFKQGDQIRLNARDGTICCFRRQEDRTSRLVFRDGQGVTKDKVLIGFDDDEGMMEAAHTLAAGVGLRCRRIASEEKISLHVELIEWQQEQSLQEVAKERLRNIKQFMPDAFDDIERFCGILAEALERHPGFMPADFIVTYNQVVRDHYPARQEGEKNMLFRRTVVIRQIVTAIFPDTYAQEVFKIAVHSPEPGHSLF